MKTFINGTLLLWFMTYKNIPGKIVKVITYPIKLIRGQTIEEVLGQIRHFEELHRKTGYADHNTYLKLISLEERLKQIRSKSEGNQERERAFVPSKIYS